MEHVSEVISDILRILESAGDVITDKFVSISLGYIFLVKNWLNVVKESIG